MLSPELLIFQSSCMSQEGGQNFADIANKSNLIIRIMIAEKITAFITT